MRRCVKVLATLVVTVGLSSAAFAQSAADVRRQQALADKGNPQAQTWMGYRYETGTGGIRQDEREAARLYRLAADKGFAQAQNNLGWFYHIGKGGLVRDDVEALRLFRLAADRGNDFALNNLGLFYEMGHGGLARDDRGAAKYYKLAADKGNPHALANLGYLYQNGRGGLAKDEREAARLYKLGADKGNTRAQRNLAYLYQDGSGVAKDEVAALRLFRLAADGGDGPALNSIGYYYNQGIAGLPKDEREAVRYYRLAAEKGSSVAQYNLGTFYENGRGGVEKDAREAARYYKLSSDQGYRSGQRALASFYDYGAGGLPKDEGEARRLYKLAADQGDEQAKTRLSKMDQPTAVASAPANVQPAAPAVVPAAPVSAVTQASIAAERRIALVIGNSAYREVPALPNPANDARAVADSLKAQGFASVRLVSDATRAALIDALSDFQREADTADWAMIYYAGHGIEISGINYLVPVDARLRDDRDVQDEAVPMNRALDALARAKKLKLVLLDACRDNPFLQRMRRTVATRSTSRGLAAVDPIGGTLVVFAAKDGETAEDGVGNHSPFTTSLVKRMAEPGVEINRLFRLVTGDVLRATGNRQRPFVYGSLPGEDEYYFKVR